MYKRILVPTDGSDAATVGLQEAIKLAKDQNAPTHNSTIVNGEQREAMIREAAYIGPDSALDGIRVLSRTRLRDRRRLAPATLIMGWTA